MASSTVLEIALTFLTFFLVIVVVNADNKIVQTHILFRHGDRSPIGTYETNPYDESAWPQGYGQLSSIGMQEEYELGQFLRKKYIEGKPYQLLNESYVRTEIVVRSTDVDRTLMSAYSNLAGLYPPQGDQIWNKNISWQPIPVHTVPVPEDNLLHMDSPCPEYDKIYQETLKSDEVVKLAEQYKDFFEYVKEKTGKKDLDISNIWMIYDVVLCESKHNMTVPEWTFTKFYGKTVFEILQYLDAIQFDLQFNRRNEARLKGGSLLKKVISDISNKTMGNNDGVKAYLYSAHDDTMTAFLSTMNLYNKISPPYAACVMIDLHLATSDDPKLKVQQDYYITVSYRNSSNNDPVIMQLPGCETNCSLAKFLELTKKNVIVNWHDECRTSLQVITENIQHILLLAIVVLIFVFIITMCVGLSKSRKSPQSIGYSQL